MPETQMNLEITPKTRETKAVRAWLLINQASVLHGEKGYRTLSHRGNWVCETDHSHTILFKGRKIQTVALKNANSYYLE